MKFIFAFLLGSFPFLSICAQDLSLDIYAGASNYQGDLQDKRFTFDQSKLAGGIGVHYGINENWDLRGSIIFGQLTADDKYGKNKARNLNFSSNLVEFQAGIQYNFRSLSETITPYAFAGVAVFHFNPYTHDSTGAKYFLQPLSTEGQGFQKGNKIYGLTQFAIPFGAGANISISDRIGVGIEIGLRKLFTDYLDDVSKTYVDKNVLLTNRGPKAVELAFRGGEINPNAQYPVAGQQRGGSSNDWYYFTMATFSFKIGSGGGGGNKKEKLGCPANVL
jgi:hypothetical protein